MEEQDLLRQMMAKNRELEKQLTKRNEQYIFDLKKAMNVANLSEEEKVKVLDEMLTPLVEGQKTGKTARQLFGTVSERLEVILNAPKPSRLGSRNELWLDNSLLMFGFLSLMAGLLPMLSKTPTTSQQGGLFTLLIGSISGGYAFYLIYKYIYSYDHPDADKSKKPGIWKSMLLMAGIMLGWMVVFMLTAFIPPTINIVFQPAVYVVIGAGALALRYYLRKKLNLTGSMFIRQ